MITKIKRPDSIKQFPSLPLRHWDLKKEEFVDSFPESFGTYVLTVQSKSFKGHIKNVASQITKLTNDLRSESLVFLCDFDIAWRYRNHDFIRAKEGLQYLADNKIGRKFNGALKVDMPELQTFIKHLCWLIRTNAVFPCIYFTDIEQSFFATICQYGNLHLSTTTKQADKKIKAIIKITELNYLKNICSDQFSGSSEIKGRSLTV